LAKNKPKYEYYGSRAILLVFSFIEIIAISILLIGYYSNILYLKLIGVLGVIFGFYIIISNFVGMFSLIRSNKKNKDILDKMVKSLQTKGDELALDAGCGRGRISNLLAKQLTSGRVIGIDIGDKIISSNDVIERAKQNAYYEGVSDKTEFIRGNILDLPFGNDVFDIIVCNSVLEYLSGENSISQALQELKRVIHPNGKFMVLEMVKSIRGFLISTPLFFRNLRRKEEWKRLIKKEGFSEIEKFEDRGRVIFVFQKI